MVAPSFAHAMNLAPEVDLVLSAVRVRYSGDTAELERAAARNPDWSDVDEIARQHAVSPLVHSAFAQLPDELVPEDARARFRARAEQNGIRNLEQSGELLRLLERLERAGIEAVPYKGPVLASEIYGDVALREFVDLDILMDHHHVTRGVRLLEDDGYRPHRQLTSRQERFLLRTGHDRKLIRDGRFVVELQWALADSTHVLPRDLRPLFRRTTETSLGGKAFRTLCPEDIFIVLCVHASLHFWERLAWVCDVAEAVRRWPDLDAGAVERRARAAGVMRMMLLGLEMSQRLLGVRPTWQVATSRAERAAASRLADELANGAAGSTESGPDGRAQLRLRLAMCDHAADRGRELIRLLFTPSQSDWMNVGLPDWLWPAYYPLRLARLAWSYGVRRETPGERSLNAD
jgi:hypothetical protein